MGEEKLLQILEGVGAVIKDSHIVYTSGKHGRAYVNLPAALMDAETGWQIALNMADLVRGVEFDTVAGPTHVGDKVGYDLGIALLHKGRKVQRVYAQEGAEEGKRSFPRGQTAVVAGMRVLVVDDVLTTGGTIRETIEAVRRDGGIPVVVAVVCNRSSIRGEFAGLPLLELMYVPLEAWDPEDCQACVGQVPMNTTVGHGNKWLAEHPDPDQWPAFVRAKSGG